MNGARSSSAAVDSAKNVCARLHQAYRDHRLYPPGHPTTKNTMQLVDAVLNSYLNTHGALVLTVTEASLLCEGEEVYLHADSRDNLAFLMFRDGIRSLTLMPGIEPEEVGAFVDCLARADQMADTDQDLSTVLWERDMVHVQLEVVDPFSGGESGVDESFEELRNTVLQRLNELGSIDKAEAEAVGSEDAGAESVGMGLTREEQDGLGEEDLALTEEEIERGEWLVSHPTDILDEFSVVLLEIVANPAGLPGGEDAVFRSVSMVLGRYLDDLNQEGVGRVLSHLYQYEATGVIAPGTFEKLFAEAATPERLSKMIIAAAAISPERVQEVERFLARVRVSIYPALLETLATSDDRVVRKTVLDLLRMEGGTPIEHIWPLMKDRRWYVVRNAVQLVTGSGDPAVVSHLEPLVRHADERVRREVVRSLGTINEPRSLPLLTKALQDKDPAVRILAVRALTRLGGTGHFGAVQSQVESRDFETRSTEEVEAFMVAYGSLGGEQTVNALNKMWKRRVFGTRPMPLRLGALAALGAVGGAAAEKALGEAMKSGDPQIQRAAAKAMTEMQARTKGAES